MVESDRDVKLEWRRFRSWQGAGGFRELTVHGSAVYLRKWTVQANAKLERLAFPTAREASAHAERLIAKLLKAGFEPEPSVKRWLFAGEGTPAARAASRRAISQAAAGKRLVFREALQRAGIEYSRSFLSQTETLDQANALADRCLSFAYGAFEVSFVRAERVKDREHGVWRAHPVPDDELALFYRSPTRVAAIAQQKLRGQLRDSDGSRMAGKKPARKSRGRQG